MGEEMEANTCYLGIELNDSYAMVSYMQPNMEEPETVSTIAGSENYRIPTLLARRKNVGMWYYGEDAGRMAKTSEVICVDSLLRRAAASEVITIAKESYDAVDLLALFIKKSDRTAAETGKYFACDRNCPDGGSSDERVDRHFPACGRTFRIVAGNICGDR